MEIVISYIALPLRRCLRRPKVFAEERMAEVHLDKVVKVYPGNVTAVKQVSLAVRDKELLVLVGPSGCGGPRSASFAY